MNRKLLFFTFFLTSLFSFREIMAENSPINARKIFPVLIAQNTHDEASEQTSAGAGVEETSPGDEVVPLDKKTEEAMIEDILKKMQAGEKEVQSQMEEMGLKDDAQINIDAEEVKLLESVVEGTADSEATEKLKEEITAPPKPSVPWQAIDIWVPENELVEKFKVQYLTNFSRKRFVTIMERAAPYRKFIRERLKHYNMPLCLEYLPVIESGFNTSAVSKAGAAGMWQFMKNSVSPYGIRITEWFDERKDPWLMTDAALQKLTENYKALGDWYLALAAYNAGLGRVRSAVRKNNGAGYWELSAKKALPKETINYVPKFLAVAEILHNAEYYGIELPPPEDDPLKFDRVDIDFAVDMTLLAEKLEIEEEELFFLNPALNYTITPPGIKYGLRIRRDKVDAARELFITKEDLVQYDVHKIRTGDTFYDIAKHYGIEISMIEKANPKVRPSRMRPGDNLLIPKIKEVPPFKSKSEKESQQDYSGTYTIKSGDTLWNIAKKFGITVETLAEKNNLSINSPLQLNSLLKVPIIQ